MNVSKLLVGLALVLPLLLAAGGMVLRSRHALPVTVQRGSVYPSSALAFSRAPVGPAVVGHPRITNVQITPLNSENRTGVLVCDAGRNAVLFYLEDTPGSGRWSETTLVSDVLAPAHATVVDIDQDGDQDVVVSVLGNIEPDDGVIGRVLLLEYRDGAYHESVILDYVRRVADAQAGDLDGDGDLDLAVAVFGYNRGQVLWLENVGQLKFREHELFSGPGVIHVPVVDLDGDQDLDIAAVVTQDEEELWGFENTGNGTFTPHRIWFTHNFDLGTAGLLAADMDQDGDVDLVLPAGDNLEDFDPVPQPYHGCYVFENQGGWNFRPRRVSDLGGTYAAATGDIDGDGDPDMALVSMANLWDEPQSASVIWLENLGDLNFQSWQIDSAPTHLVTVAIGDLNGDQRNDIAAGGLHIRGPYKRLGRVTSWVSGPGRQP